MLNLFRTHKNRKGFTLIELLVVIAIIGVLASIVLASLATARRKSRDARRITDVKQLQLAMELHFDGAGTGQYPLADTTCSATNRRGLSSMVTDGYIPTIPTDPLRTGAPDGECYAYATPSTGTRTTYHIGGSFEDTGNPALASDRDCLSNATGATNGCPRNDAAYTGGFAGGTAGSPTTESTAACIAATNTNFRCYDLVP